MSQNWTWDDYDYIYNNFACGDSDEIAQHLGRSILNIEAKAQKLNVSKCKEPTTEEIQMYHNYKKVLGNALIFLMPDRSIPELGVIAECVNPSH